MDEKKKRYNHGDAYVVERIFIFKKYGKRRSMIKCTHRNFCLEFADWPIVVTQNVLPSFVR